MSAIVLGFVAVTLVSALLTWFVRQRALARGMVDRPNARSSHTRPVPRGGGLSIVVTVTLGATLMWIVGVTPTPLFAAIVAGGLPVAAVGYIDDRRSLSARSRIAVHTLCALWAVWVIGGLPPIQWGSRVVDLGIAGDLVAVLAVIWSLNLFNFMDGIDGIAGSEALFVAASGAFLAWRIDHVLTIEPIALLVAAACLGFLMLNWPPASVFMGDVGSGYLGYVVVVLALQAAQTSAVGVYVWLLLGGAFLVDATVTLGRRLARKERVYEAHRTHAYQWLARRWRSHARVTVSVVILNLLWLLPAALLAAAYPQWARWIVAAALTPVVVLAVVAGAGRAESS